MLLQVLINGILIGGMYAAFSVGFCLVFGVLRIINIIHGEFIMIGAFATYWLYDLYHVDPLVSIPISFFILFILGYLLERYIIHRITEAPEIMSLLLTFGMSLIIANLALTAWKADYRIVNPPYSGANFAIGDLTISYIRLVTFIFSIIAVAGLFMFLQKTETGRAIRATAQNKEGARLLGVNPFRIYAITFALGAGITGVAGSLLSLNFTIFPTMGAEYLLFSFLVVVVGGMGYIPGALVGGLLVGILQSVATNYLGAGMTAVILFFVLYMTLILRPTGIFGKGLSE